MADILDTIIQQKHEEVARLKSQASLQQWQQLTAEGGTIRGFIRSLTEHIKSGRAGIIAEIKKASPSKGTIREDFDPVSIATSYADAGASCLSVLTDRRFFQGENEYLTSARHACSLPVLRKDFIISEYQVYEARSIGADAILLIAAALDDAILSSLGRLANILGMDVLIEVHDLAELHRVLSLSFDSAIIGVNNRNLRTFETDLKTTVDLLAHLPEGMELITESGILSKQDVAYMQQNHIHGFLVGEAFMRAPDPGAELKHLFSI